MNQLATQHDATSSLMVLEAALSSEEISNKLKLNIKIQLLQNGKLSSGQKEDLEDEIFATVMKRAVENRHRYDAARSKPITWLNGIAYHVMQEEIRQRRRFPRSLSERSESEDDFIAGADDRIRRFEDQDWFEQAKLKLSKEEITLLDMSVQGMDGKAMAENLGISHGAVRVRVSRMMNKLKDHFNNQHAEARS